MKHSLTKFSGSSLMFLVESFFRFNEAKARDFFAATKHSLNKSLATLLLFLVEPFFASTKENLDFR
jgi:hypothetical protein